MDFTVSSGGMARLESTVPTVPRLLQSSLPAVTVSLPAVDVRAEQRLEVTAATTKTQQAYPQSVMARPMTAPAAMETLAQTNGNDGTVVAAATETAMIDDAILQFIADMDRSV